MLLFCEYASINDFFRNISTSIEWITATINWQLIFTRLINSFLDCYFERICKWEMDANAHKQSNNVAYIKLYQSITGNAASHVAKSMKNWAQLSEITLQEQLVGHCNIQPKTAHWCVYFCGEKNKHHRSVAGKVSCFVSVCLSSSIQSQLSSIVAASYTSPMSPIQ